MPVQKQTRAGQRTRFKAFVAIGDSNGHVGLGVKCSKEVATAIRGAIILAKLSVIPVRRGYWGNKIGQPHTVPCKVCHCHQSLLFIYCCFDVSDFLKCYSEYQYNFHTWNKKPDFLTDFMQLLIKGDRQMWFSTCTSDSCTKRNWHCVCPCPQEAASDGWYWGLLHISSWTDGHSWEFW